MIDIWLFVPLGTGLCKVYQKKWVLLIPFIMSVAIEMTQYFTGLGIAELTRVKKGKSLIDNQNNQ